MPSLKEVKNRINSVKSTQQITKAMKMVAAAKMRKAQDKIIQLRPYSHKLSSILEKITATMDENVVDKFSVQREIKKVLIVLITSDRGLCGAFNSNVAKGVLNLVNTTYKTQFENGNVELLTIGTKGRDFFKRRDYNYNADYVDLFTRLSFETVKEASEFILSAFIKEKYDVVEVVYNEFKNVATQIIHTEQFLPITADHKAGSGEQQLKQEYIYEPDQAEILEGLIPYVLKIKFFSYVLESNAAEHGARMTAMDKATDNATDLLKELNLTYNRTRQAAITKEILEIVGGAEALANG